MVKITCTLSILTWHLLFAPVCSGSVGLPVCLSTVPGQTPPGQPVRCEHRPCFQGLEREMEMGWDEAVDCFALGMKGFVDCPQISRLKTEGNYWDDAAWEIKARAASRLWQRRMRGAADGGAAGWCLLLRAAERCSWLHPHLFQKTHWKRMSPSPSSPRCMNRCAAWWAEVERGVRGQEATSLVAGSRKIVMVGFVACSHACIHAAAA